MSTPAKKMKDKGSLIRDIIVEGRPDIISTSADILEITEDECFCLFKGILSNLLIISCLISFIVLCIAI
jgi:hypothetical protein